MAVVLVMGVTVASLLFIAAAATIATNSQGAARHESQASQATSAADSGLQTALFWLNQVHPTSATQCAGPNGGRIVLVDLDEDGSGWCPRANVLLENGSYAELRIERASETTGTCQTAQSRRVVSVGHSSNGTVTRTLSQAVSNGTGTSRFLTCGAQTKSGIKMVGRSLIDGNAATEGDISMTANSTICGDAAVPDITTDFNVQPGASTLICNGKTTTQPLSMANDEVPTLSETQNGTIAVARTNPATSKCSNSIDWDAAKRTLVLSGTTCPGELWLTGSSYRFCQVTVKDRAVLHIADRTDAMRIFIDDNGTVENGTATPDPACQNRSTQMRFWITGGGRIDTISGDPSDLWIEGAPGRMDGGRPFKIAFGLVATTPQYMAIWAPSFQVDVFDMSRVVGGVAADSISMGDFGTIRWVDAVNGPPGGGNYGFNDHTWTECSPLTSWSTPAATCQ